MGQQTHLIPKEVSEMLGVLVIEPASPLFLPWHCVSYPLEYAWIRLDTLRTLKILKNL